MLQHNRINKIPSALEFDLNDEIFCPINSQTPKPSATQMPKQITHVHIQWNGPYSYNEALKLKDGNTDFGIYQIYGSHPIYGSDILLYIGKAARQTFGTRLGQEKWDYHNQDSSKLMIYTGRLAGYEGTPQDDDWLSQISLAERLLIYSHWPAGNSSGLNACFGEDLYNTHILNWGQYRDLLPEVSGARYSDRFSTSDNYKIYGEQ